MTSRRIYRSRRGGLQRGGFTLRELMVAFTVGGTVMMTAVSLLHHSFDWSNLARHRRMDDQTFFNLSRQLRYDIHLASDATVSGETESAAGDELKLTTDSGNLVTYTISDQSVIRLETHQTSTVRHERYRWKRPRRLTFSRIETEDQIQLNAKSITPFVESEVPLWRSIRVSVGLRLRHQNGDIAS